MALEDIASEDVPSEDVVPEDVVPENVALKFGQLEDEDEVLNT